MAGFDDVRSTHGKAPGDQYSDAIDEQMRQQSYAVAETGGNKLDQNDAKEEHRKLLTWYYLERERQATNRLDMAMDADFYDNLQWDPEDAQILRDRGQLPLVYNEVAPMVDWIIGTERRTRVDWKVLPRTEDDVQSADVKTKVLKYVSDINRCQFNRSRAFGDAAKVGVGWLDDGVRDDPTADILYSKYEDWRNVLWDSMSYEHDLSDARYVFRWRWVDEDVAVLMFPDRAAQIRMAVEESAYTNDSTWEEDTWQAAGDNLNTSRNGQLYAQGAGIAIDAQRRRVKIIEAQYRKPVSVKIVGSGPMKGAFFDERDGGLINALNQVGGSIIDKMMMRVHVACFTEAHMLSLGPSIFRHNRFSLTPIWCYRRGRDRLPYGVIRRVRDIQQDLNKRASKALFMLNTNQIIADEGATDDWNQLRDEADRPDGLIVKKQGKEVTIRRDTDAATGQIQIMTMDAQSIQKSAGVSQENLGRQTNAVSGEAIKARQLQGSVVTTEPFDNLRLATQIQGEKQLSLVEQFYTEEKVVRLTGTKGALEWVKINVPEQQADGSIRYINDITASMADFLVSEQDYAGTLRQVMFESLNQLATRLPPEVSLRIMTIAMEFSDLPNKDEIADQIRRLTGDRDPNKEMTPEEMQAAQEQMAQQQEAMQIQRETAMNALAEQQAKVREINARAAELEMKAQTMGMGGEQAMQGQIEAAVRQVREQAAQQIDALSQQLQKAQLDAANKTMAVRSDADVKLETARITAASNERIAEINNQADQKIAGLEKRMEDLLRVLEDTKGAADEATKLAQAAEKAAKEKPEPAPAPAPAPTPAPAPAAPMTINVQVDAKSGEVKKSITVERDKDGNITGAKVDEAASPKKK